MPRMLVPALVLMAAACGGNTTAPQGIEGTYALVSENDDPVPSDPSAPFGCCLTLSGSLALTATEYDMRTSHRNKNNGIGFDNAEQGTYSRSGNTLSFTRTAGGGEGFPYLLGPGTISGDGDAITLLYGDEGPGSNQIRAIYRR